MIYLCVNPMAIGMVNTPSRQKETYSIGNMLLLGWRAIGAILYYSHLIKSKALHITHPCLRKDFFDKVKEGVGGGIIVFLFE